MKKKIIVAVMAVQFSLGMFTIAFAGEWKQDNIGYWYQNDDGSYPSGGWQWIDGNGDEIAECYYFDSNGYLLISPDTPEGYSINQDGAWVIDGIVQTKHVIRSELSLPSAAIVDAKVINSYSSDYNPHSGSVRLLVSLSDGTILQKDFSSESYGWYGVVEIGDVTGDGEKEIVLNLEVIGSTFGATDVYIYQVKDHQLTEHSRIMDSAGVTIKENALEMGYMRWDPKRYETKMIHWNGTSWVE